MAKRSRPARPSAERAWFVYQLTEAEGHALCETSGLFMTDTPLFKPLEERIRQLAKSCGYERYIILGRDGYPFYSCAKKGSPAPPATERS